jgi:predicted nucleic acid-binding Zn ribbon protein
MPNTTMAQRIGDVIARIVRASGLQPELDAVRVPEAWAHVVGARLAARTEVRQFAYGTLRVHVVDAVWRQELTLRREELRLSMNSFLGREVVREIIIR